MASCFDFSGKRNKIVYSDMNFPSVMYFWEAQRSRGARVHMVKTDDGITVPLERLLDAIDETTLLVPISHVIFRSAYIQDAKAIIEKAHKVGAHVVLDTFQSLGTVPVDVQALNVGFRLRRSAEVALRRAGRGISVRASGSGQEAGAEVYRLDRAPEPFRLRDWSDPLYRSALSLHERNFAHPGTRSGAAGAEDHQRKLASSAFGRNRNGRPED